MEKFLYKQNNSGQYKFLMAFPAIEEFALSSLGYMWLFKIASEQDGVNAVRISTDKIQYSKDIGAISFSMSFDFDFMGVFEIMEKLKIPFFKSERNDDSPVIFAGGPVITTNPEPYKDFFDFMIIGDGEEIFPKILDILKSNNKKNALQLLSKLEGIYINNNRVKKLSTNLNKVIYTPILSADSYFKETFIIEIARGCMNRCAFCTASYLNLPFRNSHFEKIIEAIDLGLKNTDKIALLGAQVSAHPQFNEIINYINQKITENPNIELGISSLRADSITPKIIQTLVKGGQKTTTIAIEAASEKLRKFINKNIKEEQILEAIKVCRINGLKGLKIYSMIGIPNETEDDIEEFINLAKKIKAKNNGFRIEFSFSSFVPKPQTPFQWEKREGIKEIENKQKFLEKNLRKIGFGTKFSSAKWDYWQTVLSRSGEEISRALVEIYKKGGKIGAYKQTFNEQNIDTTKSINGFCFEENLPWDNIENYTSKERLINEYKRLMNK